jgi:plasmid stability protein
MAQIIVRNIEDEVKSRLRRRAARHGRSMQDEMREILRDAVKEEEESSGGLGTAISSLFQKVGFETDIPELRGHKIRPAHFGRRK